MVKKAEKRKREEDKETTFVYNGLRWTKERAAASASRTKKAGQNDEFMGKLFHLPGQRKAKV